jgi:hypothetical protein
VVTSTRTDSVFFIDCGRNPWVRPAPLLLHEDVQHIPDIVGSPAQVALPVVDQV